MNQISTSKARVFRAVQLKAKYGGLEVSEARRLRLLEEENSKLKRLLAESVLDNAILKDLLGKV